MSDKWYWFLWHKEDEGDGIISYVGWIPFLVIICLFVGSIAITLTVIIESIKLVIRALTT